MKSKLSKVSSLGFLRAFFDPTSDNLLFIMRSKGVIQMPMMSFWPFISMPSTE